MNLALENVELKQDEEIAAAPQARGPHVPRAMLKELSVVSPWRSPLQLALELGAIGAAALVSHLFWHPILYALAVIWIGSRQHAIWALIHDAAHSLIHKNRFVNDCFGEFMGWIIFVDFAHDRATHMDHHRYLTSDKDPESKLTTLPFRMHSISGFYFVWFMIQYSFGWLAIGVMSQFLLRIWKSLNPKCLLRTRVRVVLNLCVIALFVIYPPLFKYVCLYWFVPFFTWKPLSMQIRGLAEHHGLDGDSPVQLTRNTRATLFDKLFISPNNLNYHNAHHIFASVPWYNLPKLNSKLEECPVFTKEGAYEKDGYLHFLRNFWKRWTV